MKFQNKIFVGLSYFRFSIQRYLPKVVLATLLIPFALNCIAQTISINSDYNLMKIEDKQRRAEAEKWKEFIKHIELAWELPLGKVINLEVIGERKYRILVDPSILKCSPTGFHYKDFIFYRNGTTDIWADNKWLNSNQNGSVYVEIKPNGTFTNGYTQFSKIENIFYHNTGSNLNKLWFPNDFDNSDNATIRLKPVADTTRESEFYSYLDPPSTIDGYIWADGAETDWLGISEDIFNDPTGKTVSFNFPSYDQDLPDDLVMFERNRGEPEPKIQDIEIVTDGIYGSIQHAKFPAIGLNELLAGTFRLKQQDNSAIEKDFRSLNVLHSLASAPALTIEISKDMTSLSKIELNEKDFFTSVNRMGSFPLIANMNRGLAEAALPLMYVTNHEGVEGARYENLWELESRGNGISVPLEDIGKWLGGSRQSNSTLELKPVKIAFDDIENNKSVVRIVTPPNGATIVKIPEDKSKPRTIAVLGFAATTLLLIVLL